MGAPFDTGTWTGVAGAYYTGLGGAEMLWLVVSIVLCLAALIIGGRHEKESYDKSER